MPCPEFCVYVCLCAYIDPGTVVDPVKLWQCAPGSRARTQTNTHVWTHRSTHSCFYHSLYLYLCFSVRIKSSIALLTRFLFLSVLIIFRFLLVVSPHSSIWATVFGHCPLSSLPHFLLFMPFFSVLSSSFFILPSCSVFGCPTTHPPLSLLSFFPCSHSYELRMTLLSFLWQIRQLDKMKRKWD